MPDPTDLLSQDHREVEQLFEQYRRSADASLVEKICTELAVHAAIEEKVLYPVLGADVDSGKGLRQHAEHEHQEVKDAIFEIGKLGYDGDGVDELMQQIIRGVTEHVREEEAEIFPKLRDSLGEERLAEIGEELAQAKEQVRAEAETAGPLIDLTKERLYELARDKGVECRSDMTKDELVFALRHE